jgi:hypothetical protein
MHIMAVKDSILCECGLISNQYIAGEMGISSFVDVPLTKDRVKVGACTFCR